MDDCPLVEVRAASAAPAVVLTPLGTADAHAVLVSAEEELRRSRLAIGVLRLGD
jgi:hypothetical protein